MPRRYDLFVVVRRALLCLGAGVVCTVVVAAWLALFSPIGSPRTVVYTQPAFAASPRQSGPRSPLQYPFAAPETWPRAPDSQIVIEHRGFRVDAWHATGPRVGDVSAAIYRSGWPMLAMERWQIRETRGAANRDLWVVHSAGGIRGGVAVPEAMRSLLPAATRPFRHRIPLVPLPLGFAVNTLLAAGLLYLLLHGWGHIVRARRRALGLCIACGYDAGELTVCPECGEAAGRAGQPG